MISPFFAKDTIVSALLGGVLLGATVVFKTGLTGEVLGVSGSTRGCLTRPDLSKAAFVLGLVWAGEIMHRAYNGFEPMPPPASEASPDQHAMLLVRFAVGSALVGFGTALGNGCTSGHGLTGLARLSRRSWVAVPTFMATGLLTASLSRTATALPPHAGVEAAIAWSVGLAWVLAALAVLLLVGGVVRRTAASGLGDRARADLAVAVELLSGLSFGCALSVSGMARPSKVVAFLDVADAWDPCLAFVMGGALLVTFPFFQLLERRADPAPVLGEAFHMPPRSTRVDVDLVAGAAIFGVGWGTCGICPGPLWVLVGARPTLELLAVALGLLLGMSAWLLLQRLRGGRRGGTPCPVVEVAPPRHDISESKTDVPDDADDIDVERPGIAPSSSGGTGSTKTLWS